ncbi:MAG: class I SAM-dependent methyltransferase [Candidatus Bathyarchaeota archaeon]|nr:MAG: class I SAM-dependent methyltransferase [Candidatus Bathyarchaeota archaeon]
MSSRHETGWDGIYHRNLPKSLPWELGKPREVLMRLVDSGRITPCETLDLCCGVGTNPSYLAEKGFNVTALDVSDGAVKHARDRMRDANVAMNLLVGSFLNLPFKTEKFGFIFDFGCFHHVEIEYRTVFIMDVKRVLKRKGTYFMVCFSSENGPAWNHFRKEQIEQLFKDYFDIKWIRPFSSLEGDNVTRHFYEVLMEKLATTTLSEYKPGA